MGCKIAKIAMKIQILWLKVPLRQHSHNVFIFKSADLSSSFLKECIKSFCIWRWVKKMATKIPTEPKIPRYLSPVSRDALVGRKYFIPKSWIIFWILRIKKKKFVQLTLSGLNIDFQKDGKSQSSLDVIIKFWNFEPMKFHPRNCFTFTLA